jgi:hypothetical protein
LHTCLFPILRIDKIANLLPKAQIVIEKSPSKVISKTKRFSLGLLFDAITTNSRGISFQKALKTTILGVLLMGIMAEVLSAQVGRRGESVISVSVSATITESVTMETIANINFGRVSPGMTEIYINPRTDNGAGVMRISGSPNMIIRVSFLEQRELSRIGGGEPLFFTYEVSGAAIEDQFLSELMTRENRQISLNATGEFYFWIGGRLDLTNISFGQYEGEFSMEIDYI